MRNLAAYPVALFLALTNKRISKYHRQNDTMLYKLVNTVKANWIAENIRKSDLM